MPSLRPLLWSAMLAVALLVGCGGGKSGSSAGATVVTDTPGTSSTPAPQTTRTAGNWTRFGYNAARTNVASRGLGAAKVASLSEQRVRIAGTVDSSPIYFSRVHVNGRDRELLVMTTTYGKTLGVDASSGATLWTFTPSSYSKVAGSAQITTATPVARTSGRIVNVFNSLCSNRRAIINPSTCGSQESAIWGRAGAVVDPVTRKVYATSSNGPFNGSTDWGDSVLELSPGVGRFLRHWTPTNERQLAESDTDVGSTSPGLLPDPNGGRTARFLLQGGKDARIHLLDLHSSLFGVTGSAGI